jgi:methionyl-tRNA formyltransferase
MDVPFLHTERLDIPEVIEMIERQQPSVAISVNWKTIIPAKILNFFEYGIINAHAGDLPRYRGNATPNWAILSGESQVVLTLHLMSPELDAGPILMQRAFPLLPDTRIGEVYEFIERSAPEMYVKTIAGIEQRAIVPRPQPTDPGQPLRCFPRIPSDGEINWELSAKQIDRLVRATSEPFAGAYSFVNGEKLIIWRAHPEHLLAPYLGVPGQIAERRIASGEVAVLTGDGVLVLEKVETARDGRKRATDIIKTIRTRLGLDISSEIDSLRDQIAELQRRCADLDRGG